MQFFRKVSSKKSVSFLNIVILGPVSYSTQEKHFFVSITNENDVKMVGQTFSVHRFELLHINSLGIKL